MIDRLIRLVIAVLIALAVVAAIRDAVEGRELYPGAWSKIADATSDFLTNQRRPTMKPWTGTWQHDSCCGPADAYETDTFESEDGELWATITEGDTPEKMAEALATQPYCNGDDDITGENNDEHSCKKIIPSGTRIHVPKDRIIENRPDYPNTTGHGWIWLDGGRGVFCYAYPSAL